MTYSRYEVRRHNTISEMYFIYDTYFDKVVARGLTKKQSEEWRPE